MIGNVRPGLAMGQNPDTQLVTDKVWHELAFGLENLGVSGIQIRRRTAEIDNILGWRAGFRKPVSELLVDRNRF